MNKPNLAVELTPEQLEQIRDLAASLGLVSIGGKRAGDGSPRQLLIALAKAQQADPEYTRRHLHFITQKP